MTAVLPPISDFVRYVAGAIGADDTPLRDDQPLGSQLTVDSVRMVELAIVLEQELGIDLPDDVDLRSMTLASLYERYAEGSGFRDDGASSWAKPGRHAGPGHV
jgi:acyl carrier protein